MDSISVSSSAALLLLALNYCSHLDRFERARKEVKG